MRFVFNQYRLLTFVIELAQQASPATTHSTYESPSVLPLLLPFVGFSSPFVGFSSPPPSLFSVLALAVGFVGSPPSPSLPPSPSPSLALAVGFVGLSSLPPSPGPLPVSVSSPGPSALVLAVGFVAVSPSLPPPSAAGVVLLESTSPAVAPPAVAPPAVASPAPAVASPADLAEVLILSIT